VKSRPGWPFGMRSLLVPAIVALAAILAGCAGPATTTSSSTSAPAPLPAVPSVPKVDAKQLLADLNAFSTQFPERWGTVATHEGARGWIASQFKGAGLDTFRVNYTTGGLAQADVVGVHWGQVRDQIVVVGGHYDTTHWDCIADESLPPPAGCAGHKTSAGAYDDGSGTMITVQLAKAFANATPYYTTVFVTYDGEERGLEGCTAFIEAVTDGKTPLGNVTFRAALDMDMFGITWPGTMAPIQVLHNSPVLYGIFDAARRNLTVPDDMVYQKDLVTLGSSDFQDYFDKDVPTIFFSSDFGKFAAPGPVPANAPMAYYPFWHLEDTYTTMVVAAGSEANLQAGFTTAVTLSADMLHAMAYDPGLVLEGGSA